MSTIQALVSQVAAYVKRAEVQERRLARLWLLCWMIRRNLNPRPTARYYEDHA